MKLAVALLVIAAIAATIGLAAGLLDRETGTLSRDEAEVEARAYLSRCGMSGDSTDDLECRLRRGDWACYFDGRSGLVFFPDEEGSGQNHPCD